MKRINKNALCIKEGSRNELCDLAPEYDIHLPFIRYTVLKCKNCLKLQYLEVEDRSKIKDFMKNFK